MDQAEPTIALPDPPPLDPVFRNGSLTAVSVVWGFSMSFLTRWAGIPGPWQGVDLIALTSIVLGIACQTAALASLLSLRSLDLVFYARTTRMFLVGLALVAAGIAVAITGDLAGDGQRILG